MIKYLQKCSFMTSIFSTDYSIVLCRNIFIFPFLKEKSRFISSLPFLLSSKISLVMTKDKINVGPFSWDLAIKERDREYYIISV